MPQTSMSIAQHYHARTKYDPETIANKAQPIEWNQQPIPFKEYKIGAIFELKPYLQPRSTDLPVQPAEQWGARLSRLLLCSYGLTAMVPPQVPGGEPFYLRSAPSAGGLYPAEIYLISRGSPLLPPGLYNYQPKTHSLIQFWDSGVWEVLKTACFDHPAFDLTQVAILTTAVFFRSAWRYQDRAYRRICLDTGHLLGNLELSALMNQFRPCLVGGFVDQAVNELLYLDSEQEGALSVIPLLDLQTLDLQKVAPSLVPGLTARASQIQTDFPELPDGQLLHYFHQATQLQRNALSLPLPTPSADPDKYNFPFCLKVSTVTTPIVWGDQLEALENTILTRRSTRAYSGESISLDELKALLNFTYQPEDYLAQGLDGYPDYFDLSLIQTFIAVSGVEGLEEGCYYYAPRAQELRQIRFKNFRSELHHLCLGQNLGRDAAAVVFHTADLQQAVAKYGDRVYRYLHLDAGHLGQRFNLAAIHLGLGVSGIGGFFDDQVNEVLGIPADEAVLYITTLGRPR